jgi:hypothetical protein
MYDSILDTLHKVVGQMLALNPKNRPSASVMLNSADFQAKLQLGKIVCIIDMYIFRYVW